MRSNIYLILKINITDKVIELETKSTLSWTSVLRNRSHELCNSVSKSVNENLVRIYT